MKETYDKNKEAFVLGYYAHLETDKEWVFSENRQKANDPVYDKLLKDDPSYIWEIKKDWYGQDFEFIKANPHGIFKEFLTFTDVKDYFDFFPPGAFRDKLFYIQDFYTSEEKRKIPSDRYFTKEDMDTFVDNTTEILKEKLKDLI